MSPRFIVWCSTVPPILWGWPHGGRGWITRAHTGSGQLEMTADILTSPGARRRVVDSYYADLLNRPPDPGGEGAWTALLQAAPAARSVVADAFLASQEFFSDAGSK